MHNDIKDKAKKLKEELKNNYSIEVSHTQALNIVAKVEDYNSYSDYNLKNEKMRNVQDACKKLISESNELLYKSFNENISIKEFRNLNSREIKDYAETYTSKLNQLLDYYLFLDDMKLSSYISSNSFNNSVIAISESYLYFYNNEYMFDETEVIKLDSNIKTLEDKEFSLFIYNKEKIKYKKIDDLLDEILKFYSIYKFDIYMFNKVRKLGEKKDYDIERDMEQITLFGREIVVGNSITFTNLENKRSVKLFYSFFGIHTQSILEHIKIKKNTKYLDFTYSVDDIEFGVDDNVNEFLDIACNKTVNLLDLKIFDDESYKNCKIEEIFLENMELKNLEEYFFELFQENEMIFESEIFENIAKKHLKLKLKDSFFDEIYEDSEKSHKLFKDIILKTPELQLINFLSVISQLNHIIKEERLYELLNKNNDFKGTRRYKMICELIDNYYDEYVETPEISDDNYYYELAIKIAIQTVTKDISLLILNPDFGSLEYDHLIYLKGQEICKKKR